MTLLQEFFRIILFFLYFFIFNSCVIKIFSLLGIKKNTKISKNTSSDLKIKGSEEDRNLIGSIQEELAKYSENKPMLIGLLQLLQEDFTGYNKKV